MKKANHIFIALTLLFIVKNANAQLFITAGGGYGFSANKQMIGWEYTSDPNSDTYTGVYGTFGQGMQLGVNFGYSLCEYGGLEIGYSFLHPLNNQIYSLKYDDRSDTGMIVTGTDEYGLQMHRIIIGGRFHYGDGGFKPYMRGGIVLGVGGKLSHGDYRTYETSSGSTTSNQFTEYTGGLAFGYTAGFGAHYAFSDMIGLYFEASYIGQNWAPEKSLITRYDIDGVDQLPNMTTRDKETVFVEELTFTSAAPNDNAPDEDIKSYLPLSTIGINFGVVINL
jgi:hypothetical protein